MSEPKTVTWEALATLLEGLADSWRAEAAARAKRPIAYGDEDVRQADMRQDIYDELAEAFAEESKS